MNRGYSGKVVSELQDERVCNCFLERDSYTHFDGSLKGALIG